MVEYLRRKREIENYRGKNKELTEFGFHNPTKKVGEDKMKKKVEETIKIPDGEHEGEIIDVQYRDEPFEYVDVIIEEKELEIELKCGVPFKITENTSLGLMLERFGAKLETDSEIEIEDFIKKGRKVKFLTITEKTEKGKFARILSESVKPIK